jgi:hypothetical protein
MPKCPSSTTIRLMESIELKSQLEHPMLAIDESGLEVILREATTQQLLASHDDW